mmetsp:Transcript_35385/g.45629  ORF Transcript_35385/g.45629 Transcript_35385/m.45629 type:complete len:85 (-) Transcript_35385:1351-1605(-)
MESVRDFGDPGFQWTLGEPGEPPLPGGVIDLIADKLDEIRGLDVDGSEGDSQVGSHSKGEEGESIDGRGRAAIAKAAREVCDSL